MKVCIAIATCKQTEFQVSCMYETFVVALNWALLSSIQTVNVKYDKSMCNVKHKTGFGYTRAVQYLNRPWPTQIHVTIGWRVCNRYSDWIVSKHTLRKPIWKGCDSIAFYGWLWFAYVQITWSNYWFGKLCNAVHTNVSVKKIVGIIARMIITLGATSYNNQVS